MQFEQSSHLKLFFNASFLQFDFNPPSRTKFRPLCRPPPAPRPAAERALRGPARQSAPHSGRREECGATRRRRASRDRASHRAQRRGTEQ